MNPRILKIGLLHILLRVARMIQMYSSFTTNSEFHLKKLELFFRSQLSVKYHTDFPHSNIVNR